MTSRRSRIKGIANIPQRRKPTLDETEIKLKVETGPSSTSENTAVDGLIEKNAVSENDLPKDVTKSEDKISATDNISELNNTVIFDVVSNFSVRDKPCDNNLIVKKKIIKIPVSLNAIQDSKINLPQNEHLKESEELNNQISVNKNAGNSTEKLYSRTATTKTDPLEINNFVEKSKDIEPHLKKSENNIFKRKYLKIPVSLNAIQRNKRPLPQDDEALSSSSIGLNKSVAPSDVTPVEEIQGVSMPNENSSQIKENLFQKPLSLPNNTAHSDTEYPLPPPSPNKTNRSRIKAIPRLAYRKTSFSASESEDESRKINRIRNDSVCSTTSVVAESIAECHSPQRQKDIIASILPKRSGGSEQTRKLAEARREFIRRFGANKPERHKLTMLDLIFYNPDTNPMTIEEKNLETPELKNPEVHDVEENVDNPEEPIEETAKSDEENNMPVPQIKIGPSGEIILDEQSLLIERKDVKRQREEMEKKEVVDADKFKTAYGIYKRKKRSKFWSHSETLRFYKALNTIGTDFMLMCELFPDRVRRELKTKFKKEEKLNRHLIDRALMNPCNFDFDDLKHELETEEKELEELIQQKEEQKKQKNEKLKENQQKILEQIRKRKATEMDKKQKTIQSKTTSNEKEEILNNFKAKKSKKEKLSIKSFQSDSDADESDLATQSESEEEVILSRKPTRSGRLPKVVQRYENELASINHVMKKNRVPDHEQPSNIEPGSIMIITEKGSNGEPIYKIYMVTPEQKATRLDVSTDVITKAIQLKKGVSAENLMTISANVTDDEDIPEENNVTIPADKNVTTLKSDATTSVEIIDASNLKGLQTNLINNVKVIATEKEVCCPEDLVMFNDDPEILLEVNNEGICSKINTVEDNVTIPADDSVVTLRTKVPSDSI